MSTPAFASYRLFTPLTLDDGLVLKNRIVMAPLTRARADQKTHIPNEDNQLYYEQRAGAGLIITEATAISEQGFGWFGAAAMYNEDHVEGWKEVTERVHARHGKIFLQLWHMGRQGHPSFNPQHEVVSASAIGLTQGRVRDVDGNHVPYAMPRALETEEIPGIVDDYRKGAALARIAGFDGVEIHAANGYLIDQFLQSVTNQRTDEYGGSVPNRARFLLELVDAIKQEWPASRIGVRLSPNNGRGGMGSADNFDQFVYTIGQLAPHKLAYVAILDGEGFGYHDKGRLVTAFDVKQALNGGIVLANNSYTRDLAEGAIRSGAVDFVSFGRPFIANPDLVERMKHNWPLHSLAPPEVWWDAFLGAEGYTTFSPYDKDAL